jgi:hypothetical protein
VNQNERFEQLMATWRAAGTTLAQADLSVLSKPLPGQLHSIADHEVYARAVFARDLARIHENDARQRLEWFMIQMRHRSPPINVPTEIGGELKEIDRDPD